MHILRPSNHVIYEYILLPPLKNSGKNHNWDKVLGSLYLFFIELLFYGIWSFNL